MTMKHEIKELSEWTVERKYGKYFPKDFFSSREEGVSLDRSENGSQKRGHTKHILPPWSEYKKSVMSKSHYYFFLLTYSGY
jgi:hypothetical protein